MVGCCVTRDGAIVNERVKGAAPAEKAPAKEKKPTAEKPAEAAETEPKADKPADEKGA